MRNARGSDNEAQHYAARSAAAMLAGCGTPAAPGTGMQATAAPTSIAVPTTTRVVEPGEAISALIDPQQPLTSAGDPQWQFQRTATADFDGDGVEETAFIIADALVQNGRALRDDGHRWQVYIEHPDGTRTYVYARFLPNGKLEALLSGGIAAQPCCNTMLTTVEVYDSFTFLF